MARIWTALTIISIVFALLSGRGQAASTALMESGSQAVTMTITLLSAMPLWSGLMEILSAAGDVERLGRIFRRLLRPLFPGMADDLAWNAMSMNLSANLLGLGNAATPAGIEAAKRLAALGEDGLRALAMLLVLDNASLQLIPTTVITLRHAAGSKAPGDIWGMTLLISGVTMLAAAMLMRLIQGGKRHERTDGRCHCGSGGIHPAAGRNDGL